MKLIKSPVILIHILLLIFSVLILYLPTLSFNFVLDDHQGVEQNQLIRSFSTVFDQPFSIFRNVPLLISYHFGQLDPAYYRIMNLLFHLGAVLGVYMLVALFSVEAVAFFVALLFSVHPLLIESTVWISVLPYLQYSFFLIFSMVFYIKSKKNSNYSKFYIFPFVLLAVLATLSSEKALVLPVMLLMYEWLFGSVRKNWKVVAAFFVFGGVLLVLLYPLIQTRIALFGASYETGKTELLNPFVQIPVVLGTYINLIFWPQRLTIYHLDEQGIQTVPLVINSVLSALYLLGLALSYMKSKKVFFFLSIFFIANLPALIPIHIIQIAAERYAYLGSFGLIAAVVITLFNIFRKYRVNVIWLYVILSLFALALAWRTTVRARDWESEMSIRLATLKTAPYSARAHNNVGIQLMNEGNDEEALVEYKKAIVLKPDYSHPYHNIGHMLALRARYEEALPFYLKAVKLNKYEWKTRQDLGQVYFLLKKYPEAKEQLQAAIDQGSPEVERLTKILNKIEELGY